ncbi:MAG: hypothetical protein OHK006_03890 [Thermodesulfovibrionales bacterium]
MNLQRSLVSSFALHAGLALVFSAAVRTSSLPASPFWVSVAGVETSRTMTMQEPAGALDRPVLQPAEPEAAVEEQQASGQTEAKSEPALPAPAQPEKAGMPTITPEQYHQYLMLHTRAFAERAGRPVKTFLDAEIGGSFRMDLRDAVALVRLSFSREGALETVEVLTESDALVSVLQKFDWNTVPPPSRFLPDTDAMAFKVVVRDGAPFVTVLI